MDEEMIRNAIVSMKNPEYVLGLPFEVNNSEEAALNASLSLVTLNEKIETAELDASAASAGGKNQLERDIARAKLLSENAVYQTMIVQRKQLREEEKRANCIAHLFENQMRAIEIYARMISQRKE